MTFVIKLGGSLFLPDEIDVDYLKVFTSIIRDVDDKFVITPGGGFTARKYMTPANEMTGKDPSVLGMMSCRLNAQLIHSILDDVHPEIFFPSNVGLANDFSEKFLVVASEIPGTSSDFDAVKAAVELGFTRVIDLSNISYVYDKDPKQPGAKKLESLTWQEYLTIVGEEWSFGSHVPFDQHAARLARDNAITVIVADGKDLENLKLILSNKPFKGTTIHAS